jgi:GWxTD domain-containing protein
MKRILETLLVSFLAVSAVQVQAQAEENLNESPIIKEPLRILPELEKKYRDWLKKDVAYIITSAEKKAFRQLETDEERDGFIENFWHRRDPDPFTEVNEFREEYFARIAYANENFASGIPGWMTDRGRIHIVWGKPDKLEKGYGTFEENINMPYETWFYEHLEGVGDGVELTFIDPTETDEFQIFKPKAEPVPAEFPGAPAL